MKYDIAVIGGGPAGMMTAGRAGELGQKVVLLEKNQSLGVKLLATGHGRCNLTNMSADQKDLIGRYGKNGKFLLSSFHKFGVVDTLSFFNQRGVVTKVEDNDRVFPRSDKARDVLQTLQIYLASGNVEIKYNAGVKEIIQNNNVIEKVILENNEEVVADKFVICVGGKTYPMTGSTGDAYTWLEKLGHTVVKQRPVLTPLVLKEDFIKTVEGVSLANVGITLKIDDKKRHSSEGPVLFTADGLSGPAIINLSREIDLFIFGKFTISLDLLPEVSENDFDIRLQKEFQRDGNKIIENSISQFAPARLASLLIYLAGIDLEKQLHEITKQERKDLVQRIKNFTMEIIDVKGFDKAMVTAGGVDVREVNPATMQSKKIKNLYFAGEILDVDGPTGGFNLQICWSTGFVAGSN